VVTLDHFLGHFGSLCIFCPVTRKFFFHSRSRTFEKKMFTFYLIFGVLIVEMILIILLLSPLPSVMLKPILNVLQLATFPIRFLLAILAYFTFDSGSDMFREQAKKIDAAKGPAIADPDHFNSLKFRAERNFYLCSFAFCMALIVMRVSSIVRQKIALEAQLKEKKS